MIGTSRYFPSESISNSELVPEPLPEKVQDWHYMVRGFLHDYRTESGSDRVPEATRQTDLRS